MKLATYILTSDLADAVEESVSKNFITFDKIKTYLVGHLPSVVNFVFSLIIAIIVLLVGIRVIKLVRKIARKAMKKTSLDRGLQQFLDHLLNLVLYFVLIMIILGTFGITASAVIAIIGTGNFWYYSQCRDCNYWFRRIIDWSCIAGNAFQFWWGGTDLAFESF